jgi:hypothetical protein
MLMKIRIFLGFLLAVVAIDVRATDNKASWRQVAPHIKLDPLVEANIGGRAALCSWVEENKTTVLVGTKNKDGKHGIKKLVYSLGEQEPKDTDSEIELEKFIPRTILRTNSGILYLTANSGIDDDWSEYWEKNSRLITAPKSLKGGVWASVDNGNSWTELIEEYGWFKDKLKIDLNTKHYNIMNAGYIACYKQVDTTTAIDNSSIRVGGAGVKSIEITCFKDKVDADKYKDIVDKLLNDIKSDFKHSLLKLDEKHYFVISVAVDFKKSALRKDNSFQNPLLVRIGELPTEIGGTILKDNILRFNYFSANTRKKKSGLHLGGSTDSLGDLYAAGTPLFDNSNPEHLITTEQYLRVDKIMGQFAQQSKNTNLTIPADCYKLPTEKTVVINGKYRHCTVSYDNTGLILTGKWQPSNKSNDDATVPFDGVSVYFDSVAQTKFNQKYAKTFNRPQEVVAQHKGFMAVTAQDGNDLQVHIANKNSFEANAEPFDKKFNASRIMITGVNHLGWYSEKSDIEKYNGRLLALGQSDSESYGKFDKERRKSTLLKLYMRPTQVKIENDCALIKNTITGEPYAKIKYWLQRSDSDKGFSSITQKQAIEGNSPSIVKSATLTLNEYGIAEIKYTALTSGYYRLVASAVIGGFYCDYEEIANEDIDFNKVGSTSDFVPILLKDVKSDGLSVTHKVYGKKEVVSFKYDKQDVIANDRSSKAPMKTIVELCPNSDVVFDSGFSPKNVTVDWSTNNKTTSGFSTTKQYFENKANKSALYNIKYSLTEPCTAPKAGTITVKVFPELKKPIVSQSITADKEIKETKLSIPASEHYTQIWQLKDTAYADKWHNVSSNNVLVVPHLASLPVLNPNPNFDAKSQKPDSRATDGWSTNGWVAIRANDLFGVKGALMGPNAHTLESEDFIMVDSSLSYLYIAAAKNAEAGTNLTLAIECYDKNKKHKGKVTLPEATITDAWSSYGAIIGGQYTKIDKQDTKYPLLKYLVKNNQNTECLWLKKGIVIDNQDQKYQWPKGTTFVKLAINLPKSNDSSRGAYVSAVRLMELPKDTRTALETYVANTLWKNQDFGIAKAWDACVGYNTADGKLKTNTYRVTTTDKHCGTNESETEEIKIDPKFYFEGYKAYIDDNNTNDKGEPFLKIAPKAAIPMKVIVKEGQELTLEFSHIYSGKANFHWEKLVSKAGKVEWTDIKGVDGKLTLPAQQCFSKQGEINSFRCMVVTEDEKGSKVISSRIFEVIEEPTKLEIGISRINGQYTNTASLSPGDKVELSVELKSVHHKDNEISYQWFQRTKGEHKWDTLPDAQKANLIIYAEAKGPIVKDYKVKASCCGYSEDRSFKITTNPKSPVYVNSGDSCIIHSGTIGDGTVSYAECVEDANTTICSESQKDNYLKVNGNTPIVLAAGRAINYDPTFTKCASVNECLEKVQFKDIWSHDFDAEEKPQDDQTYDNVSLKKEGSLGVIVSCGDAKIREKEFTLIQKGSTYLVIANGCSEKLKAKFMIGVSTYDKKKDFLEDILIDETSVGKLWTSFGGLVKIKDDNDNDNDKARLLPEKTVYIKYIIRLNQGDTNCVSPGCIRNVRIIPLTANELIGLKACPKNERLANYWDSRAGSDASGNQLRTYNYYAAVANKATTANLRHVVQVKARPPLSITLTTKKTKVVGGTEVELKADITPGAYNANQYMFSWEEKMGDSKGDWKSICPQDDIDSKTNEPKLKSLRYKTKVIKKDVKDVEQFKIRLIAKPVVDKFNDKNQTGNVVASNEITINVHPAADEHIHLDDVTTCVRSDTYMSLNADSYESVQWQIAKEDDDFKDHSSDDQYRSKLPTEKLGKYKVRANIITGYNELVTTSIATVVVDADITIRQQPKSMKAYKNSTNVLSVQATGDNLTYEWEYRLGNEKDTSWQPINTSSTNTLEVLADKPQTDYRVVIKSNNCCPNVVSEIATVTAIDNFKLNLRGKQLVLAGHLAYFETDAPDDCEIDWEVYENDGHGHNQARDYDYVDNKEAKTPGKKSISLMMPDIPGTYTVKATVVDAVNNRHRMSHIGILAITEGHLGDLYPYKTKNMDSLAFVRFQQAFGSKAGDLNYDVEMDANGDGKVEKFDQDEFIKQFKISYRPHIDQIEGCWR